MNLSGLGAIAVLEAFKGVLAVLVAIGVHALAGVDLHQEAVNMFAYFHLAATNHYAVLALHSIDKINHSGLTLVTMVALGYALIRFIEAYGLWHRMRWTEWFAFLSGAVYLPFEIYEVIKDQNVITLGVLGINIVVVSYMYWVLKAGTNKHLATDTEASLSHP
ncbi:DUF2127 domain-containing protein [Marinomonas pollencensis]|uniref:Uncharacterized membrane protein (DUF2068 family) n=1 Tax=Marinomonas pollencensis TaxID=491954 RepID=A0A3E0DSW8_9GAMM|nr:DUF2127 domain-containing protein [Marinomonas pollencensis]REG86580.1 uncharacterized membrane protein (DUF2068 family) [Marinomonas pollencensis]